MAGRLFLFFIPIDLRAYLGDGNYAGVYQRSDDELQVLWQIGVEETRAIIDTHWAQAVV